MNPPDLPALVESVRDVVAPVRQMLEASRTGAASGPSDRLVVVARHVVLAFDGLAEAARDPKAFVQVYRAVRESARASEALYPIAATSALVSRFFTEPGLRDDATVASRLAAPCPSRDDVGITHFDNDRESRGGFSMYVPENYDSTVAYPLIIALHGGSGHGADFLWSWLREARTHGAILVAPTSVGRTWSLQHPEVDAPRIQAIVDLVQERWHVDAEKMMLTGMSDGGTFTLITGLRDGSPFTHLAPCSTSFHPLLVERGSGRRMAGLPVYQMHGALDWMFPVERARLASAALRNAGANLIYREIGDLAHTFPRDETPRILDWFLGLANT